MLLLVLKDDERVRKFEHALLGVTKSVENGAITTSFTELRKLLNQLCELFPPVYLAEKLRALGLPLPLQWAFHLVDLLNQAIGSTTPRRETGGLFFLVVARMVWVVIQLLSTLSPLASDKVCNCDYALRALFSFVRSVSSRWRSLVVCTFSLHAPGRDRVSAWRVSRAKCARLSHTHAVQRALS